jgi:hypothetical protein
VITRPHPGSATLVEALPVVPTGRTGKSLRVSGLHLGLAGFLTPTRPLTRRGQRNAARREMTAEVATALYDQDPPGAPFRPLR